MDGVDDGVALVAVKVIEAVVVSVSECGAAKLLLICQRRRRCVEHVGEAVANMDVSSVVL